MVLQRVIWFYFLYFLADSGKHQAPSSGMKKGHVSDVSADGVSVGSYEWECDFLSCSWSKMHCQYDTTVLMGLKLQIILEN